MNRHSKLQYGLYSVATEQTYEGKHTEVIDMHSPHKCFGFSN